MKAHGCFLLVLGVALTLVSSMSAAQDAEPEVSAAELRLKAAELMREARELKQTGNEAQARELAEQAGELLREAKLAEPAAEHIEPHERLQALRQRIMQLREEGRMEEADRLEREARQSMELLHKHRQEEPLMQHSGEPFQPVPADAERRMHHLRVAAENLHAAGLHDQAEKLMQQAQRMAMTPKVRPMAPGHDGRMDELIGHLRRLNERVERLEQAVKKMIEQQQP